MSSQTNEEALEVCIQNALTRGGYEVGNPSDFSAKYGVDEKWLWHFLETTQPKELAKLQKHDDYKRKILERLDRMIKKHGILKILKKGLEIDDAHFVFLYPYPLASSSQKVKEDFEKNIFSVMRQVRYSVANPLQEIDVVLFVNGLGFCTMELKNQWTGQNAKVHGQKQYRMDRDQNQPLLQFGRCVVHFTLDTDEAYMTTKLEGASTIFLPFNKGNNHGKGNLVNPDGHKTAYIWEEVFARKSVANILEHFVRFDGQSLYFPRYHQLDVVNRIVEHASKNGVGQTYLIQHSAGSGKSNSITWTAYRLIATYPDSDGINGSKGVDYPLFDSVIVVTDRRLLDKQLRDNIRDFSEVKNIVAPALSSAELKSHLENGKKIIITTIQKFPFIVEGMSDLSQKRFAVIIDEAHSSQGGSNADSANRVFGREEAEEEVIDVQDKILEIMRTRKMQGNTSYFAFTATPKSATLEKFGVKGSDGSFKPFHLYSMKQAIEEGFILDVLANYTTYKSYYEIEKSIEDNPLFDTKKAQKKLKAYVEKHKQTIGSKAEIMLEHFITKVVVPKKLKGKAKAIVATQSIESAINYFFAIRSILNERGNPFKALIAFSGKKTVRGIEYTEDSINGFAEKDTKDKFDTDEYRILVVANKYLTGFDQPKLCAMYVDKKLQDVMAVQALSRLNRSADKLGKKTEDLFVLDFFNSTDDIKKSFDPFYTATTLSAATDVNVLHELKQSLDEVGVYEWSEVEEFVSLFFAKADGSELSPIVDKPAERFNHGLELSDMAKADFKIKAKQFVKIYGQVASIIEFEVEKWEKLFWFLKFLIPKLVIEDKDKDMLDELLNSVDLSTYGLERVRLNASIGLDDGESQLEPQNPNPRGVHGGDNEENELDLIIRSFNEKWFQGWEATPEDQRVKFVNLAKKIKEHPDFTAHYAQNQDPINRDLAFSEIFKAVMTSERKKELDLYRIVTQDDAFRIAMEDTLKRMLRI
jgi:type I restriction enzyme, R subunit